MNRHLVSALLVVGILSSDVSIRAASAAETVAVNPELLPYASPGTLAKLPDGRVIHLICMGTGSPTVILTAGLGNWSEAWRKVQPAVAKSTRVCAWDRAGFGFSDGSRQVQTVANTTSDHEAALRGRQDAVDAFRPSANPVRQYF